MAWKIDSDFARYSTLGIQFGVTLLVFGWLGVKLDAWLGSAPWGMLALGALGFIVGMYSLIRGARRREKKGD
jgi:F0F1-type ATP synthase assembly protein I